MNIRQVYNEANLTLEILGDFQRKDRVRQHLLEITSITTLEHILNVKRMLEDAGVHLIKND